MADINWTASNEDIKLIGKIVDRAERMKLVGKRVTVVMDLMACHANGTPLRLADLLAAPDFDFTHDIVGIQNHIDRETGQLRDCFLPRYACKS